MIRRLLCRIFGHPRVQVLDMTLDASGGPVIFSRVKCLRCGKVIEIEGNWAGQL